MTYFSRTGRALPEILTRNAKSVKTGALSRREFLATACSFGATAGTAYAMLGMAAPSPALAAPQRGGVVRIQQELVHLRDPRTFDFNALATFTRGWLEYLVQYNSDGTFTPKLLESWEVNDDATEYLLNIRPGVTWNDGTAFTAADVAYNIERFCDATIEGNAMTAKLSSMVDPDTQKLAEGAVEIVDDLTLRVKLNRPDISIISSFADYPAAIVPQGFDPEKMLENPIGTGPYLPEFYTVKERAALVRNPDHQWWDAENGAYLDRIELIDYGSDPSAHLVAAASDEVDVGYDTPGDFLEAFDQLDGWTRHEVTTGAAVLARCNQKTEVDGVTPYADVRVRRALAMAVDPQAVLELGYAGQGEVGANHHVSPVHPDYADIGPAVYDPEAAMALMQEAGMADYEHELISLNGGFWASTADAIAADLRKAGFKVKRTLFPSSTFWNDWTGYSFSVTNWNHRPFGIQTYALAYTSGANWNETGFANEEFDTLVEQALATPDLEARREIMRRLETIMVEEGVIIQPYFRGLANHTKTNLKGAGIHISQELYPQYMYWEA